MCQGRGELSRRLRLGHVDGGAPLRSGGKGLTLRVRRFRSVVYAPVVLDHLAGRFLPARKPRPAWVRPRRLRPGSSASIESFTV
jgi:hypothetical protein